MEYGKVLDNRYGVRKFKADPVPAETIREAVAEAGRAPSWVNSQPWKVYVATGDKLEELRAGNIERGEQGMRGHADFPSKQPTEYGVQAQANMAGLSADQEAKWHGDEMERFLAYNRNYFDAPCVAFLTVERRIEWSIMDLGAFEYALMLAATARGLATMVAYEFVKYPEMVKPAMGIPEDEVLCIGVAMGWPAEDDLNDYRSPRMAVDDYLKIVG